MSYEDYIIHKMLDNELYEVTFEHFEDIPDRGYVIAYGSNKLGEWEDRLIYYDDMPVYFKPSKEWIETKICDWAF